MITSILIILSGWMVFKNRKKVKEKAGAIASKQIKTRKSCWYQY